MQHVASTDVCFYKVTLCHISSRDVIRENNVIELRSGELGNRETLKTSTLYPILFKYNKYLQSIIRGAFNMLQFTKTVHFIFRLIVHFNL